MGCGASVPDTHVFAPIEVHDDAGASQQQGLLLRHGVESGTAAGGSERRQSEVSQRSTKGRSFSVVSIEELQHSTDHRGWQRPVGGGATQVEGRGGGSSLHKRSQNEVDANGKYEKLCGLWPTFSRACFEGSVKAVAAGDHHLCKHLFSSTPPISVA